MLWTILLVILVLWVLGAFVIPIGGGLIHLLLVLAVIVLVYQFVTGRRA
ncbi:lmo0937 family membrane protein [Sphingobium sp. AP49]|nr:lmo0937 family membrane protein [Sphingobium sp. AP49]WHO39439.1 lmo0937 family membrane protein [Sphingobium sp. AP49]